MYIMTMSVHIELATSTDYKDIKPTASDGKCGLTDMEVRLINSRICYT